MNLLIAATVLLMGLWLAQSVLFLLSYRSSAKAEGTRAILQQPDHP